MNKQAYAGLLERLVGKRQMHPGLGGGTVTSDGRATSYIIDDGKRLINPDGPEAAEAISSLLNRAETAEAANERLTTAYLRASETKQSLLKRVGELEGVLRGALPVLELAKDFIPGTLAIPGTISTMRAALNSDAPLSIGEGL